MKRRSWFQRIALALERPVLRWLQRPWVGRLIEAVPFFHAWVNKMLIKRFVGRARYRPHPFSTRSSYTSWASLTDRSWTGRHLAESDIDPDALPDWDNDPRFREIFYRPNGVQRLCPKSTVLFAAFAQYLTDGFLRTMPEKDPDPPHCVDAQRRKLNTSNHEIDLCTLYGRNEAQTRALRVTHPTKDTRGRLKSRMDANGEEFPEFLFQNGEIKQEFICLDRPLNLDLIEDAIKGSNPVAAASAADKRDHLFAVGGDRVNSVPQVALMNTLWLREHNRLARELIKKNDDWDDDRVFETARNIVIVQFIKVVIEDYINHIAPFAVRLIADPRVAWHAPWNKPNWITVEFGLLYRWHFLIPDRIRWGHSDLVVGPRYFMNNQPLLKNGLQKSFESLSAQPSGELGPRNTNDNLLTIERDSIRQGRICNLASYNKYREYIGREPVESFDEISSDPAVVDALKGVYGEENHENVDFFVGIFAEDRLPNSPLSRTILTFVALDAFSQALTNPLLSEHVFAAPLDRNKQHPTFTNYGMEQINTCKSLREIVRRNIAKPESLGFVGMTRQCWRPEKPS